VLVLLDLGHLVAEGEVAMVEGADALAVDAHQVAAGVVVDHGLVGLALVVAAEEQAAVGTEVVLHLQGHLEVAVLLLGDEDAAVARLVLAADDGPVLDDPAAAAGVLALGTVAGPGADLPALEGLAVEDGDEALFLLGVLVGPGLWSGKQRQPGGQRQDEEE